MSNDLDSPEGRAAIARVAREHWLLAFDFDGTLAPFVDDPQAATLPRSVHADLTLLAQRRTLAVLTGRARRDVLPRLPPGITQVVGNHGCEGPDAESAGLEAARAVTGAWRAVLDRLAPGRGLRLEDKGVSLALHWRGGADPHAHARAAVDLAAGLSPPAQLIPGDQVLNLLPMGLPNKGTALLLEVARSGCPGALFVGDDITDAAVFRLRRPDVIGVEVGAGRFGATWRVPDPAAVAALIRDLVSLTDPA